MSKHVTSADYWRGYRAARICSYIVAVEAYQGRNNDDILAGQSEAYQTGFYAGMRKIEDELKGLIDKDRKHDD